MADIGKSEGRVRSQQVSPAPHQQLGSLSANQRSYSRMSSSKGMFGDESPLLSPLPYYPRRRSVTFAGGEGAREERPYYSGMHSASAPASPVRKGSPPPVGILKRSAADTSALGEEEGARPAGPGAGDSHQGAAARTQRGSARSSPVPHRGRSASRQRLAARRREAQLHHSFYDDSFVEEFVLSSRAQLEKEENDRKLATQIHAEAAKARRADQKLVDATEKISALRRAKEVLLAAAQRRRSTTPTPSPSRATTRQEAKQIAAASEVDLLKSLEDDSDPEIQAALAQLARVTAKSDASRRSSRRVSHCRRSVPIVSDSARFGGASSSDESEGEERDARHRRKRMKLEKIVSDILSQQERRGKSKRSVVVINWSDAEDSDGHQYPTHEEDASQDDSEEQEQSRPAPRSRRAATKSRSVALATEATVVPARGGRKATTSRRAASMRKRDASAAPDLGDSAVFENEEDQPILLARRPNRRPAQTRSISALNADADDLLLSEGEEAVRKVTRRAPRTNRPVRKASATVTSRSNLSVGSTNGGGEADLSNTLPRAPTAVTSVRRGRAAVAPARNVPNVSSDDPMSVFFDAAFPSPSKFDEMMQQAGGLPESRRGTGNRGRQPNLVLPSSIGRRR